VNLLRWLPIKYDADRAIKMTNPHKFPAGSTFFGQFQPSDTARRRHLHCLVMNVNNVAASAVLAQRPRIFPTCSDPLFFIFQVSEMFIGPRNLICAFEPSFHEFPLIKVGKLNGAICQITRSSVLTYSPTERQTNFPFQDIFYHHFKPPSSSRECTCFQ
jgi:hypothetical protein